MEWRWKHFTPKEVGCRCCMELPEEDKFFEKSMDALESLRHLWGKPIYLNCGHRCKNHNIDVGGVKNSMHTKLAFDCRMEKKDQKEFGRLAEQCGFNGIGYYDTFVHIDMRDKRARW